MKTTKLTLGKYLILSFLSLGLVFTSCKKEEETPTEEPTEKPFSAHAQAQVPFMLKETGELCGPCGSWGWTAWEGVINNLKGKALLFSQYSTFFVSNSHFKNQELDPANSVMETFRANFPLSTAKPSWYMNGDFYQYNDYSGAQADALVSIATPPADVNVSAAYRIKWEGDKITVDAQAKLYKNLNGNYYMGVYLIEDKAKGTQQGHALGSSVEVEHHVVMRGSVEGGVWGKEIISSSADAGATINMSYSVTVPSFYKKENISVGVIIWKKNGTKYFYENAATNQE